MTARVAVVDDAREGRMIAFANQFMSAVLLGCVAVCVFGLGFLIVSYVKLVIREVREKRLRARFNAICDNLERVGLL